MKISFFSHRASNVSKNSEELRRDDIDCLTEKEIHRQVVALEDDGWEVQEVMKGGYPEQPSLKRTGTGVQPRNRR